MQHVDETHQFLPMKNRTRVICGKTLAEWDYAVVYVHNKEKPYDPPTHMYFTFIGSGNYRLDEVIQLVDQWTYYRGKCFHPYDTKNHEYWRARKMAIKVVETYRRHYYKKHGTPPNTLGLAHTLDPDLARKATNRVNRLAKDRNVGQFSLNLDEPEQPRAK